MIAENNASEMTPEEIQHLLDLASNMKCSVKGPNSDELECDIPPEVDAALTKLGFKPKRLTFNVKASVDRAE